MKEQGWEHCAYRRLSPLYTTMKLLVSAALHYVDFDSKLGREVRWCLLELDNAISAYIEEQAKAGRVKDEQCG